MDALLYILGGIVAVLIALFGWRAVSVKPQRTAEMIMDLADHPDDDEQP